MPTKADRWIKGRYKALDMSVNQGSERRSLDKDRGSKVPNRVDKRRVLDRVNESVGNERSIRTRHSNKFGLT